MMIPEPWENHEEMDAARRAFYRFHSTLMEPWDGPACVAFTDGTLIGAVLDRNGLRPGRYWVTDDGLVILASEVGVLDIDPASVVRKGRLQPGRIFLADTASRRMLEDADVKAALAAEHPYQDWLHAGLMHLDDLPDRHRALPGAEELATMHRLAGYTEEELRVLLAPMAEAGAEPVGSMGTDTPVAVLSDRPRLIFDYFTQLFAQVTNPPLDAIREELVTSLSSSTGPEQNLLRAGAGLVPPDRAALPGDQRQRSCQDHPHQRRRGPARVRRARGGRAVPGGRGRRRRCASGWPRSAPRCRPRSPPGRGSSCCPTAARPARLRLPAARLPALRAAGIRRWHPSRRCCSPGRSTTT